MSLISSTTNTDPKNGNNIRAVLLSAGAGTRLASISNGVSKGLITIDPKHTISGCEHISRILSALHIDDVVVTVGAYAHQYEEFSMQKSYNLFQIPEDTGNGDYLEDLMKAYGTDKQYLVVATDTYFYAKDLAYLIEGHTAGTITWGVGKYHADFLMDSYHGLVANQAGAVLGDVMFPEWKNADLTGLQLFTKGAIQIIDPLLYLEATAALGHHSARDNQLDLYWDIMPLIEKQNRQRLTRGLPSIMNVAVFKNDLIDYGTPERLELTRSRYTDTSTVL